jgi:isopentenyl diphosphate isomerase/L-lactate dehydrogenase-like FMN-dependent dehydrogenase
VGELVNAFDFEEGARTTLPSEVFEAIAGGDRDAFNRMTFRPRMNVPTVEMDLSTLLLGETLFTPMIVAPFADHGAYHADAEMATVRGASQSFTSVMVSRHSTLPFERLVEAAEVPLWFSVYEDDPEGEATARLAVANGAGAVFLTLRASYSPQGGVRRPGSAIDWIRVERFVGAANGPVVLKGIETPEEAERALALGAVGVVVSTHGSEGSPHPMDRLVPIVDAIGGRAPVLVDGGIRRGTDVLKALILGARGVLVGRPIAWGLSTYGADGVAAVLRLMQNELGRSMAMLGTPTLADLTRNHLRVHSRATS